MLPRLVILIVRSIAVALSTKREKQKFIHAIIFLSIAIFALAIAIGNMAIVEALKLIVAHPLLIKVPLFLCAIFAVGWATEALGEIIGSMLRESFDGAKEFLISGLPAIGRDVKTRLNVMAASIAKSVQWGWKQRSRLHLDRYLDTWWREGIGLLMGLSLFVGLLVLMRHQALAYVWTHYHALQVSGYNPPTPKWELALYMGGGALAFTCFFRLMDRLGDQISDWWRTA